MRVTLAYPYTDAAGNEHPPDQTIELEYIEARRLLGDGFARLPDDAEPESTVTFDDLDGAKAWLVERDDDQVLEELTALDDERRATVTPLLVEAAGELPAARTDLIGVLGGAAKADRSTRS